MNLSRRNFFRLGTAAAVAASTNPVHFLAPVGGWKITPTGLSIPIEISLTTFDANHALDAFRYELETALYLLLSKDKRVPYTQAGFDVVMAATEEVAKRHNLPMKNYSIQVAHRECEKVFKKGI